MREGEVLSLVQHPSIVKLIEAVDDPAEPYLVLELFEGVSLAEILRDRGKLSIEDAMTVMHQVCHAVAAVHEVGIVHFAVTPGHLIVLGCGPLRVSPVKLIDFGPALPGSGRSDVYAIGETFYECLTGVPFEGTFVDELCLEIPRTLSRVIRRALSIDPANRFANAREMLDALGAVDWFERERASGIQLRAIDSIPSGFR